MLAFLDQVLPPDGFRCLCVQVGGAGMRPSFYKTNEELADVALRFDADPHVQVFYTPFTFKDAARRTAANALQARAFWLDIDCGSGKPYASRQDAREALAAFASRLGWCPPLVVASGPMGLHAYWRLDAPLSRDAWLSRARKLKVACETFGLHVDPTRTSDAASLLRPVGVHHRKGDSVLVEVLS